MHYVILLASHYGVDILPIDILIIKRRLLFLGSIERAETSDVCYQVLHSDVSNGQRARGSTLSYRRSIKRDLKIIGIDSKTWQVLALNEKSWRSAIDKGVESYLRSWMLYRKSNTIYGSNEISDRGRKVKELTSEMFDRKRIFVDMVSRVERKKKVTRESLICQTESIDLSFVEDL